MTEVLIVGAGGIADRHVAGFRAGGATVAGVSSRNLDRARAFADAMDIPHAYASHREALERCDAEIVTVATPPASHAEITIDALESGRHVLCEKPFAMDAAEARSMVAAAQRSGRTLGCWSSRHLFMWGLDNAVTTARDGGFGRVVHVHVDFQWRDLVPGLSFQPESPWFLDSRWNGGGVLADWGSYWIDMVMAVLPPDDRPVSVLGSTFLGMDDRTPPEGFVRDAEELALAMVTFRSGASAVLQLASRVHQETRHTMRVWGTQAGAAFNPFDAGPEATFTLSTDDGRTEILEAPGPRSMHDGPAIDFLAAVREGREPATPGGRAALVVEICDAIYTSARAGRAVEL